MHAETSMCMHICTGAHSRPTVLIYMYTDTHVVELLELESMENRSKKANIPAVSNHDMIFIEFHKSNDQENHVQTK